MTDDRCVSVFDGFNVSYRDCLSAVREEDLHKCSESGTSVECVGCDRWNCNTATVRQDDLCLQCTSNMTHCSSGARTATVCGKPSEGSCYSRVDEDGYLIRGCLSDILESALKMSCEKGDGDCVACAGPKCNAQFLPKNTLSCVQCDSREQLNCAQEQRDDRSAQYCRRHVQNDRCYVRTNSDGSLQRGCLSDLTNQTLCDASKASKDCEICSGSDCNRYVYPTNRLSCYQCSSGNSLNCDAEQQQEGFLKCRYHTEKNGCYARVYQDQGERSTQGTMCEEIRTIFFQSLEDVFRTWETIRLLAKDGIAQSVTPATKMAATTGQSSLCVTLVKV